MLVLFLLGDASISLCSGRIAGATTERGSNGRRSTIVAAFADTNIVLYAFANDDAKIAVAEGILEQQPTISVQVISEFLNGCRVKLGMDIPSRPLSRTGCRTCSGITAIHLTACPWPRGCSCRHN